MLSPSAVVYLNETSLSPISPKTSSATSSSSSSSCSLPSRSEPWALRKVDVCFGSNLSEPRKDLELLESPCRDLFLKLENWRKSMELFSSSEELSDIEFESFYIKSSRNPPHIFFRPLSIWSGLTEC